jgi:hypothetical protein
MHENHAKNGGGELYDNRHGQAQNQQGRGQDSRENMPSRPTRPPTSEKDVPTKGPFVAYVGNLPFSADENMVGNFFEGGGCGVKDVIIKLGDDGRPRGFANVEFFDRDSLCKALTANGEVMGGRSIRVDVDMKRPPRSDNASGNRRDGDRDRDGGRRGYREGGDMGGGGRDRDDRPARDEPPEPMWNRAAPRREPPPPPPRGSGNRRTGRDDRDRADGPASDAGAAAAAPAPPASRPIIKIQPRTLPVEAVGVLAGAPNQSIFGGGKAHDERAYEVSHSPALHRFVVRSISRQRHNHKISSLLRTFVLLLQFCFPVCAGGEEEEG